MELYEEDFNLKKNDNNNKKVITMIIVAIVFLLMMVIGILIAIFYINGKQLTLTLNGTSNSQVLSLILIDEEDPSVVYIPIRDIAPYLGYESFNGNYTTKSEDSSQCYVQSDDEVALFTLNSNVIYKKLTNSNSDYEYVYLDEPVIAIDGKLYTTIDGIEKAFNVSFTYDLDNNTMSIYTLSYLISYYDARIINYGYASTSTSFNNQKAILEDMLIVKSASGYEGVLDLTTGEEILETKYDSITYLQYTSDFLVTDNNKVGIISKTKRTKLAIQYDSIELMDYDTGFYKVELNDKYGVVNASNGDIIINIEYDDIGININNFTENNIKSSYILADKLIPVKQNSLWGFFDLNGNLVTEIKYTNVGYVAPNSQVGYSLVYVPGYDVIVVGLNSKYTVITSTGEEVWDFFPFDSVYLTIENGETIYKMTYNSQTLNLCDYLDRMGYGSSSSSTNSSSSTSTTDTTEDTTEE